MCEQDAESRLWADVVRVYKSFKNDCFQLGKLCRELRNLYSERGNCAAGRLSSGHGVFENELKKRGFRPNRVREWITDYEVSVGLRPPSDSTAAKRKARRSNSDEYQRGYRAAIRSRFTAVDNDPVTRFAALLPYSALRSAYRTALQELHPDHGGSADRTTELIKVWKEIEQLHCSVDQIVSHPVSVQ